MSFAHRLFQIFAASLIWAACSACCCCPMLPTPSGGGRTTAVKPEIKVDPPKDNPWQRDPPKPTTAAATRKEPKQPDPPAEKPSDYIATGDQVVLTEEFLLGTTWDNYEEACKLLRAKDERGLLQMEGRGKIFVASKGDKAKLIEKATTSVRIRMLDGKHAGKDGWLPFEFVKKD